VIRLRAWLSVPRKTPPWLLFWSGNNYRRLHWFDLPEIIGAVGFCQPDWSVYIYIHTCGDFSSLCWAWRKVWYQVVAWSLVLLEVVGGGALPRCQLKSKPCRVCRCHFAGVIVVVWLPRPAPPYLPYLNCASIGCPACWFFFSVPSFRYGSPPPLFNYPSTQTLSLPYLTKAPPDAFKHVVVVGAPRIPHHLLHLTFLTFWFPGLSHTSTIF
jgi:hypothetical protein